MGLLNKALGLAGRFAPMIPGAGGVIAKGVGLLSKIGLKTPRLVKAGAGLAAGGAAFELGSSAVRRGPGGVLMGGPGGGFYHPHRGYTVAERQHWHSGRKRRSTGLSGRDIRGAQKVARLVRAFGFKPKFAKRKRR